MLGICLEQFSLLPAEEQNLLTAVDVRGESYDEISARSGVYRYSLPQKVFGARHRLYAGVMASLAESALVAGSQTQAAGTSAPDFLPEHFPA